jgi:hypothetical protein
MRVLVDDLPEHYKTYQQFKNYIEFLEHNEWGLALESLIELADESGHFFSEDFWLGLSNAAHKMKMKRQANYCRDQSNKTKQKMSWIISKGSTANKIDDTHYQHYYSQKVYDGWNNERRRKDKLRSFIDKDGFHIQKGGRDGTIYYISNGKVCEIYWEISGVPQYDILVGFDVVDSWVLPTKQLFTADEKKKIETELILWLKEENIRTEINQSSTNL